MIKSILDLTPQIEALRTNGVVRGENTGFRCLDELYSVKQGSFTFFYAEPAHGKSEMIFEMCMNQRDKRTLVCSPETGSLIEIVAELIHKHTGKRIYKSDGDFALADKDFYHAIAALSHQFLILDTDEKNYSIPQLFEYADKWEKENRGQKIDIIVGEPYNELDHSEMSVKFGSRQDLYIEDLCSVIRRLCRKNNRHFMLSIHPSGSAVPVTKGGITYYPKPLPRQAAGGQALFRKAMTWITLWRPPKGLNDDTGFEYRENEVHIFIDKAKPKGVSFKGMCKMYFDWKLNRYYEDINGNKCYAFDHEKPENKPYSVDQGMLVDRPNNFIIRPTAYFNEPDNDPF